VLTFSRSGPDTLALPDKDSNGVLLVALGEQLLLTAGSVDLVVAVCQANDRGGDDNW
jgi:hypothetical protein